MTSSTGIPFSSSFIPSVEPPGGQERADLLQRGLAEVLVGEELVLGLDDEVAERLDVHLREAVARAHRELELRDRHAEQEVAALRTALVLLVEVHRERSLGVAQVLAGAAVVRKRAEDGSVAADRVLVSALVLVEHAEVQEHVRVDRLDRCELLVELDRALVVACQVFVECEAEQATAGVSASLLERGRVPLTRRTRGRPRTREARPSK